jgi:branched-chain amino acid transport system permease protein
MEQRNRIATLAREVWNNRRPQLAELRAQHKYTEALALCDATAQNIGSTSPELESLLHEERKLTTQEQAAYEQQLASDRTNAEKALAAQLIEVQTQTTKLVVALQWDQAAQELRAAAVFAALMGAISLRTQGVYFIMITLAFAQMLYYFMVSLKAYGGDDGLSLASRSSWSSWDITSDTGFYFLVLCVFVLVFLGLHRLINSRLGHALQAIRDNETRMAALGFSVFRIKLLAFVVAGAIGGLSGALLANQNGFVSPSLMQWSQSGMLMIMVILGGVGRLYGGLVGAAVFLLLEEILVAYTIHWTLALGALLLAVVLVAPNGLLSLWTQRERS